MAPPPPAAAALSGAAASSAGSLLLVEDSRADAGLVRELVRESPAGDSFEVVHVTSLAAALRELRAGVQSCVLLDLGLTDADGLDVLLEVRANAPGVPIVIITGRDDEMLAVQALYHGAQDYLVKGQVDSRLLSRSIRRAGTRMRIETELQHLALHDQMTGLANRALFTERLEGSLVRARQRSRRAGVMLLDLDGFKAVNDAHGHAAGDQVLRVAGSRMQGVVRSRDVIARLGGDEFGVLCEDVREPEELVVVAVRLLQALRRPVAVGALEVAVDASAGIVMAAENDTPETILRQADDAMYRAKRLGGGRYEVHGWPAREAGPVPLLP